MSKKSSNKKSALTKSEQYTNLLLITVVEAMVLLIGQLLIYNAFASASMTEVMWKFVVPAIFVASSVVAVIAAVMVYKKKNIKLWSLLSFAVYLALLMSIIRYIPNQYSQALGEYIVNSLRGQKIGIITSAVYVIAKFAFYFILAGKADKK